MSCYCFFYSKRGNKENVGALLDGMQNVAGVDADRYSVSLPQSLPARSFRLLFLQRRLKEEKNAVDEDQFRGYLSKLSHEETMVWKSCIQG